MPPGIFPVIIRADKAPELEKIFKFKTLNIPKAGPIL
jgi:hypothetical protein